MSRTQHLEAENVREHLRAVAERWMRQLWQERHIDAIEELHAPQFVDRSSAERASDNEGYKKGLEDLFRSFPDFTAEIKDLIVDTEAGEVAIRWAATGTHRNGFMGIPPTGRQIAFRGIEILRIETGRIVERWGEWDGLDLLKQLS